jgi:sugar (glycoside-pentoside-hexuronide) transporter
MNTTEKLSFRERMWYGLGTTGMQYPNFFVNTSLMFFLNIVVGIPALAVGTLFLVSRIWDAINDPIMGYIADRTRTRWGSFRPYAFFATIPMGILLFLTFIFFPNLSTTGNLIWAYITYIFFTMANTAGIIPLGSMINVITSDYEERGVLGTFRELGGSIGNLTASIIISGLIGFFGIRFGDAASYSYTSIVLSILCFSLLLGTFLNTKERVPPPKEPIGFFKSFKALKGNGPCFSLFIAFFFVGMFIMMRQMWNMYYVSFYLQNDKMQGLLLMFMALAPFVLFYFLPRFIRKWGKRNMLFLGCIVIVVSGVFFLIAQKNTVLVIIASFIAGWGQTMTFTAIWSMLPDTSDYGAYKNNIKAPGLIYSLANFMLKLSMSLSGILAGVLLTIINFDQTAKIQTEAVTTGIYWFNGLTIIVFGILGAVVILAYKLTPEKSKEIAALLQNNKD